MLSIIGSLILLIFNSLFLYCNVSALTIKESGVDDYFPFVHLSNDNPFVYKDITDFIVFGDSYSQVGTNFTDMTYTGKNRSHGKNWPLQLIDIHPMQMWNFAQSGSTTDMKIVFREPHDFKSQYALFRKLVKNKKTFYEWNKVGLFAIWIGANDIRSMKQNNPNKNLIYYRIMDEMFDIIDTLYREGARNLLILNVPPLEKIPFNFDGRLNKISMDVNYMNALFSNKIKEFAETHSKANIFLYDIHRRFDQVISNCTQYKFKDCRSDWRDHKTDSVELYFWGDFSHPTYKANEIFSNDINDFLNSISK